MSFIVGDVNVTMYAFDVQVFQGYYLEITETAIRAAQRLVLTSPTMGSEAVSYRYQEIPSEAVSLVLIPTEALTPMYWLSTLMMMRMKGGQAGYWGYSFQICDAESGTEIGSGRLKEIQLSPSHVLSNET